MSKELLGEFEHQVLLALMHQGSEGYSVPVIEELEARTGRDIAPAAVYIALKRLEEKGLVVSRLRHAPRAEGGRQRRYFAATEEGKARLAAAREAYLSLWAGLEGELERA
jgi:DNA-binding PadR family transcriptional regulator